MCVSRHGMACCWCTAWQSSVVVRCFYVSRGVVWCGSVASVAVAVAVEITVAVAVAVAIAVVGTGAVVGSAGAGRGTVRWCKVWYGMVW